MRRAFGAAAASIIVMATGIGSATAASAAPVPTRAVQVHVDGHRVTVDCQGSGGPTVILFSGFGDKHTIWANIQSHLARHNRVCSYDRLGEGTSSKPHRIQTLASNVRLLHDVLAKVHVHGPLVLVGHSEGGDIAVVYARTYRKETAGLVTLDATPVGYLPFVLRLIPPSATGALAKALRAEAVSITTGHNKERVKLAGADWAPRGSLGKMPVAVVEHGIDIFAGAGKFNHPLQNRWASGEFRLSKLSARSQLIIATRSGHYIYLNQPQLTLDVIRAVIAES